jgi:hypothetical protein
VHEPVHAPETQAWFEQAVPFCHDPAAEQVCGCCPLHWVCPGAQTPWHEPDTHVWSLQALPVLTQAPALLQVCGCWPLHCALPGEHEPVHAPLTHA